MKITRDYYLITTIIVSLIWRQIYQITLRRALVTRIPIKVTEDSESQLCNAYSPIEVIESPIITEK